MQELRSNLATLHRAAQAGSRKTNLVDKDERSSKDRQLPLKTPTPHLLIAIAFPYHYLAPPSPPQELAVDMRRETVCECAARIEDLTETIFNS